MNAAVVLFDIDATGLYDERTLREEGADQVLPTLEGWRPG